MKTELIDFMGSDLTVVNAARVSFDKESEWRWQAVCDEDGIPLLKRLESKDERLIKYLASHNHFTPFTHCTITLRETVPIFVARQRFKHTVGFSYNEVSRRYVDDTPEFYTPEYWRGRPEGSVKQGSSSNTVENYESLWNFDSIEDDYNELMKDILSLYNHMIQSGVAPEQARMVLPQSMYTSYYVTGSLYAFARAYNLRSDPHAQLEIQELAKMWDTIIRPLFPVSWGALCENS